MTNEILDRAAAIIIKFEGFRPVSYQDQRGIWTVGYGLTGPQIGPGYTISMPQAQKLLEDRVGQLAEQIKDLVHIDLNTNQMAAVISLAYNIGIGNFKNSTMLVDLNNNAIGMAESEFLRWNHVNGLANPGLTRRRNDELSLFKLPV